jgi:asparagine synthase (glutamine-hydrolysing)
MPQESNLHPDQSLHFARGLVGIFPGIASASPVPARLAPMCTALNTSLPLQGASEGSSVCAASEGAVSENGVMCAIAGHPYWRKPALQALGLNSGHATALLQAYRGDGQALTEQLGGSFCFLVFDSRQNTLMAGVDRLGQKSLYYQACEDAIVIATTATAIQTHRESAAALNQQGIYNYVYFHMVPSPNTIFSGIRKLPAAHVLQLTDSDLAVRRYWQPAFKENSAVPQLEQAAELRQILKKSVKRAVGNEKAVAAFLSGGLDSSTVTGMLSEITTGTAQAYSIGFSAEGYDEMAYARITARHFGVDLHEYYVTPEDVVTALPEIAASCPEPFGNSSALPAWFCAKFAADNGVSRLLAGDGGDELFAGNERYAKQAVFERYCGTPHWLRSYLIEPFVHVLPGQVPLSSKAKSFIAQANTPLPDRLQTYNFLHQHAPQEIFRQEFIGEISANEPLVLQREVFHSPENADQLNRMLYLDWQFTLADNDLRKVSLMCEKAGVDVTYPMLDDELLNFSTLIPSRRKLKGSDLRHFYKRAFKGWLPEATINKEKHGFGLPFGVWMREHKPLQDMAYDTLIQLKQRRYFNPDFIDRAIELHREGHASYYGELVWILMVLELWLSSHERGSTT